MSTKNLIDYVSQHPSLILVYFCILPAAAWLLGKLKRPGQEPSGTLLWLHSLLVYAACIPGILAAVLTAYSLFFLRANLLEANLLVYFLPIASMIATLCFLAKSMSFDAIPGFDRLSGLMTVIAVTFILVLALERTRIWLFFGGSIAKLAALVAGLFLLLRWGTNALFRGRGEPKNHGRKFQFKS